MSETTQTTTPGVNTPVGGPTAEQFNQLVQEIASLKKQLSEQPAQKATDKAPEQKATATEQSDKPLTLAQVQALLEERDRNSQTSQQKAAFAAEKLKGVPTIYHSKLGNDPAKWDDEAAAIRQALTADFAAIGAKLPDVAGAAGGTSVTPVQVDVTKVSGPDLIKMGLDRSKAVGPAAYRQAETAKAS